MFNMFRTLGKSVREFKRPALITPLLVMLEVVMEVLIPLLMADLIAPDCVGWYCELIKRS